MRQPVLKSLASSINHLNLTTDAAIDVWIVYRHFYMPMMGITQSLTCKTTGAFTRAVWKTTTGQNSSASTAARATLSSELLSAANNDGISVAYTFGRTDRRNPQNYIEDELAPDKVVPHVSKKRAPSGDEETDDGPAPKNAKQNRNRNQPKDDEHPMHNEVAVLHSLPLFLENRFQISNLILSQCRTHASNQKIRKRIRLLPKSARPSPSTSKANTTNFTIGDFHRHTDISLCFWPGDGTMDDAYRYGIDAAPLDFLGVTDHTHDIAMGDPLSLLWQRIRKEVNRHALEGTFIPFYSYERSRGDTDHNVISLRDDMLRPHTYPHSEFWQELDTNTLPSRISPSIPSSGKPTTATTVRSWKSIKASAIIPARTTRPTACQRQRSRLHRQQRPSFHRH